MTLNEIFDYFHFERSLNIAKLPDVAKGLIEIHRVESLRKNNRYTKSIKITPLSGKELWPAKRIILIGFEQSDLFSGISNNFQRTSIDARYDHIISLEQELTFLTKLPIPESKEAYEHVYLGANNQERSLRKVYAPSGSHVLVPKKHKQFALTFIKQKLSQYCLYSICN